MKRKKRTKKAKTGGKVPLTAEEKTVLSGLLETLDATDSKDMVLRIPNRRVAVQLIEELPFKESDPPVELLRELYTAFEEKQVRKAVKRALFRLRQRNIEVGEFPWEASSTDSILKPTQQQHEAYVGPVVDLKGSRAVMVVLQRTGKGHEAGMGWISDEEGIHEFVSGLYSKKSIREIKENFSERVGPLVQTSLSHAVALLEEAYGKGVQSGRSNYTELRPRLMEYADAAPGSARQLLPAELQSDVEGLTDSRVQRLIGHELMREWILDREKVGPYVEEILEADSSPIFLTEPQKTERVKQIKQKAVEELFAGESREVLSRRFEEMAYIFSKTGEQEYAALSLAAARSLEQEDTLLLRNPVVPLLLERSIEAYASRLDREEGQEQNLEEDESPIVLA